MKSKNFEIAKLALLNEQMGNIKDLEVSFKEEKESLSDEDKYDIKQAVLKAVANGCLAPEMLASAIETINKSGINTGNGSCE